MVSSLKSLCNNVILDNPEHCKDAQLPDVLADKLAKLSFNTGVRDSDLALFRDVSTIDAKYPISNSITQKVFNNFKDTLESLVVTHADFRDVTFGQDRFSRLTIFKLVKPRNLTQKQFDDLCRLLPKAMNTLHIIECENIIVAKDHLPIVHDFTHTEAEKQNSTLELSLDE